MGFFDRLFESRERRQEREFRERILETLSTGDLAQIALMKDDLGWVNLGLVPGNSSNDFSDISRIQFVERSRQYWHRDPLAKQAVRLYTSYALGKGIEFRHKDKQAQSALEKFVKDKLNRKLLGAVGLRVLSNKLLVDGELFFAVVMNPLRPQVRLIDPLQITEIISNPDDGADVWYYRRETAVPGKEPRVVYYRDADADWGGETEVVARALLPEGQQTKIGANLVDNIRVIHVKINTLGIRGYPLLTPVLDWTKTLRKFMENRATITNAAAQFAYKKTVKGGQAKIQEMTARVRTGTPPAGGAANDAEYERRGPQAGSTLWQNQGIDTEQFKFDTGATNAKEDARIFKLHFFAGVGLSEQYFGDPSSGNLATATAMERPLELTLLEFQEVLDAALSSVASLALELQKSDPDGLDVIMPPILNVDVPAMLGALLKVPKAIPAMDQEFFWRKVLTVIGVEDVDAAITLMKEDIEQRRKEAEATAAAAPPKTPPADPAQQQGAANSA